MLNSKKWQDYKAGATMTITAPGTGRYNTVKSISAYSDATCSIAICSPSLTTVIWGGLCGKSTAPIQMVFPDDAGIRGNENKAVYVKASAGNYKISATGVVEG